MANKKPNARNVDQNWTTKEINYLIKYFPVLKTSTVAKRLGKTYNAVRSKAGALKLRKENRYWHPKFEKYVMKHWGKKSVEEIAAYMGKTEWAVYAKHRELVDREISFQLK